VVENHISDFTEGIPSGGIFVLFSLFNRYNESLEDYLNPLEGSLLVHRQMYFSFVT
jgi:hypothetical protein